MTKLLIRAYEGGDRALLIQSFVMTYRASPYAEHASDDLLGETMAALLRAPWQTSVAVAPDAPDVILGWVTYRELPGSAQPAIGWLQVRRKWRRRGIGKALLAHAGVKPGELHVAAMVVRVDGGGSPNLVDLAAQHGITLRFRPYLPWSGHPPVTT